MEEISFFSIIQELEISKEKVQDNILVNLYSQFKFFQLSLKMENCIDDQNSTTLINHLKANKFIVYYYSISRQSISESNSIFIFCFEGQCIFVKQISNKLFNEIISKLIENEKTWIDATQKSQYQEIDNFCSNFNKVNNFVKLTIRPIAGYLIQRYFYPTDYFNDQSFFIYKGNKKLFNEQKLKKDLSNNLFGDEMREDIQKIVENDKVKENSSENAKQEFKQKDFYFLKEIYQNDNASYHLSIHSKSLYVFVYVWVLDSLPSFIYIFIYYIN